MRIEIIFVRWLAQSSFLSRRRIISTIDTRTKRTCVHSQHRKIGRMNTTKEGRANLDESVASASVPREQFAVMASLVQGENMPPIHPPFLGSDSWLTQLLSEQEFHCPFPWYWTWQLWMSHVAFTGCRQTRFVPWCHLSLVRKTRCSRPSPWGSEPGTGMNA